MSTTSYSRHVSYNFDKPVDRKNTNSTKWDFCAKYLDNESSHITDDIIPMWIADMDFTVAPPILEALKRKVEHGIYGYSDTSPEVGHVITTWLKQEHAWTIEPSSIVYTTATMTGLHFILSSLTKKGDAVVAYEPTYPPIFSCIQDCGRKLVIQSLKKQRQTSGEERYIMDFKELEEKLKNAKVFVLCNPHNPTGNVWTYEELAWLVKLCQKHDVIICSDDVHADIVYKPHTYKSIEAIAQEVAPKFVGNIITLLSPNKIFNTGGIKVAIMIVPDEAKRVCITRTQTICMGSSMDIFGITMLHAAYSHGAQWKAELTNYLMKNRDFLTHYVKQYCKGLSLVPAEATYLAWLDFSTYMKTHKVSHTNLKKLLLQKARVGLSSGSAFGKSGVNKMRLNFGCPHVTLEEGLRRISQTLYNRKENI